MFVLQNQLSVLNVPSNRVAILYRSGADIQLALPDLPSQMGSAFLVLLKGGGKVQALVGLFMAKSCRNIFYVSSSGEVPEKFIEQELEAGQVFAESMGFILNDSEFCRMAAGQQEVYWKSLPICQHHTRTLEARAPEARAPEARAPEARAPEARRAEVVLATPSAPLKTDLSVKRNVLKEHLGKLLASL